MAKLTETERNAAAAVSKLVYGNPFLPERIDLEREILGGDFTPSQVVWSHRTDVEQDNPNLEALTRRAESLESSFGASAAAGAALSPHDCRIYEGLVVYLLYDRFRERFQGTISAVENASGDDEKVEYFIDFKAAMSAYVSASPCALPLFEDPAHLFACYFQVRRAFHFVFHNIIGASLPAAQLRASVWQSVFTHDTYRYVRTLYQRMGNITTLISGPSGTGKELVAGAISYSRHLPFETKTGRFAEAFNASFYAFNLSAFTPTLIESELFGHCRGAFTGAASDRAGWFEVCSPMGTVFLDEIGELDPSIQVKLLRVLQERTFYRIGDTRERRFEGKLITATNRDLAEEQRAGRFREDLYYRLCADMIVTPSLREQLVDSPKDLRNLVGYLAAREVGSADAASLADETLRWIDKNLGSGYSWPGNVRELEQCVRNILVRGQYIPPSPGSAVALGLMPALTAAADQGMTADELIERYCTVVYKAAGSYQEAARRLDLDHRTVKKKVNLELLEESD